MGCATIKSNQNNLKSSAKKLKNNAISYEKKVSPTYTIPNYNKDIHLINDQEQNNTISIFQNKQEEKNLEDEFSEKLKKKEKKNLNAEEVVKEKESNKPTYYIIKNKFPSQVNDLNNIKSNIICNSKENVLYPQFYKAESDEFSEEDYNLNISEKNYNGLKELSGENNQF